MQGQLTGNCLRMTLRERRTRVKDELVGIQCEVDRSHKRLQHQFIQYPMTALVDLEPTKCEFYIHNTEEGFRDDRCRLRHVMAGDVDLTCSSRSGQSNCCEPANSLGHSFLIVDIQRPIIVIIAIDFCSSSPSTSMAGVTTFSSCSKGTLPLSIATLTSITKPAPVAPIPTYTLNKPIFIRTVTEDRMLEVVSHSFNFGTYTVNVDSYPRSGLDGRLFPSAKCGLS